MSGSGTKLKPTQINGYQNNTVLNLNNKKRDMLGQEILTLWQRAHGAPHGAVSVMAVKSGLVLFLENVFSQAELTLAQQSTDNLLQQYIDSLAHQIVSLLTSRIEQEMDQTVVATTISSNIKQNWMMVIIKFGNLTPLIE